jgi:hypothetical protein
MSHHKSMSLYALLSMVVVAVALVSGCGGSGSSPSATSSTSGSQLTSLLHQIGACIRSHGLPDFPDPVVNQQTGQVLLASGANTPPQQVLTACQSLISKLPAQATQGNGPISAAEMAQYRAYAACMRQHGLPNWPDPNPDGTFTLSGTLSGASARTGAYSSQMNACKKYVPAAGIHFTIGSQSAG